MLKVKDDVDLSVLRNFGFTTGKEVKTEFDESNTSLVDDLSLDSWFKFFRYEDDHYNKDISGRIIQDNDVAEVSIQILADSRRVWVEVAPIASYHVEGSELDVVTDTIAQLAVAGIIEIIKD